MSYTNDEMVRLLKTRTPISIHDRNRRVVGLAGPTEAISSTQPRLATRPLLSWVVLDYQLDPIGEVEDAFSPIELVWILMQRFRSDTLRATLDHHRYRLLFPNGTSLAWPGRPLGEWQPSQQAHWLLDPAVVPLTRPRISPPRARRSDSPESQLHTLSISWG